MKLSFDDQETFKGAIESLRFNNSDPNTRQQMGSNNSMPLREDSDSEWNEDDNIPNSPTTPQVRRVGSSNSLSVQEARTSGDIQVSLNKPPTNPEFSHGGTSSSANGM